MNKLEKIYYSPKGYWRGISAIKKLATAAKVDEETAKNWLKKQAIWQIYLPAPKYVPRPKFNVSTPNEVHQADLLFLPHDQPFTLTGRRGRKIYKYALTVVDVASRYKESEPLTSKESAEVAKAFSNIYKRSLTWPKLLQVDPGREFMGKVNEVMKSHNTKIRRGEKGLHRAQGIVERFNRTLAERLFGHQYAQEILLEARAASQGGLQVRSREWVTRLPAVVKALNSETTRLIGMPPSEAIKLKSVIAKSSAPTKEANEQRLPSNVKVRYLYQPGELEGGERRRATDPIWSLDVHQIKHVVMRSGEPITYYLQSAPKRGFVRQELLVVPSDTRLPPDGVLPPNGVFPPDGVMPVR
jgi:hypothetical protein